LTAELKEGISYNLSQGIDAADALSLFGPKARDAVPALVDVLEIDSAANESKLRKLKWNAIWTLGAIGPDAKPAAPHLLAILKSKEGEPGYGHRGQAAIALGKIGADPERVVPALVDALESSPAWGPREELIEAMGMFAPEAKEVIEPLRAALRDESTLIREQAVKALANFAPDAKEVIEPLHGALRDEYFWVREEAVRALRRFGEAEVAAPALVELLRDQDEGTRLEASLHLSEIGAPAVHALCDSVSDEDAAVQMEAIRLISQIGPASRPATGALLEALGNQDPGVRREAAFALATIGDPSERVADGLIDALDDDEPAVLASAAASIAMLGIADERALPRLLELLDAPAWGGVSLDFPEVPGDAREGAIRALRNYGAAAAVARPKLLKLALAPSPGDVRCEALRALAEMGVSKAEAERLASPTRLDAAGPPGPTAGNPFEPDPNSDPFRVVDRPSVPAASNPSEPNSNSDRFQGAEASDRAEGAGVSTLEPMVFQVLVRHPQVAMDYLKRHPALPSRLETDTASWLLRQTDKKYEALKRALFQRDDLPLHVMLRTRDPRYIPVIKQRMQEAERNDRVYLAACARFLGEKPERVVKISETDPGDFLPASAWPAFDPKRMSPTVWGHRDGSAPVVVAGRLLMPDGSPAVEPRFYRANDSMLLGEQRRDPVALEYDPRTGRFLFATAVFAAYSVAGDQEEPGPYQTGCAQVIVEATKAKPLEVPFFYEMPDVEITLSWQEPDGPR
jgi:HEAT repeat protein